MNYELVKQLKDVGFPQDGDGESALIPADLTKDCDFCLALNKMTSFPCLKSDADFQRQLKHIEDHFLYVPTLEELIEACKNDFFTLTSLWRERGIITAYQATSFKSPMQIVQGSTPTEAVALLWLALKKKI